jgi:hypothetical protein
MSLIRKLENFHILLWLLKDISWLLEYKMFGSFMIIPTLSFAIFITIKNRGDIIELLPNLAVICWICANSMWMLSEFFWQFEFLESLAIIPFISGIVLILFYAFLLFKARNRISS